MDRMVRLGCGGLEVPGPAGREWTARELAAHARADALALAAFLGRQGKPGEALELLAGAWKTCPADAVALTTAAVLRSPAADEKHFAEAEARLRAAAEPDSAPGAVLLHLAGLHRQRGRYDDAEAAYRLALRRDPNILVALNNLAWLLAVRGGKGDEALGLLVG